DLPHAVRAQLQPDHAQLRDDRLRRQRRRPQAADHPGWRVRPVRQPRHALRERRVGRHQHAGDLPRRRDLLPGRV
ncbi:MAG: hypothetical protein AVDCRST_MAG85-4281, partial [uncultured Solirubrobacteraceae bacterium]